MVIRKSAFIVSFLGAAAAALPQGLTSPSTPQQASPQSSPVQNNPYANVQFVGNANTRLFSGEVGVVMPATITTSSGGSHLCGGNTDNGQLPGGSPLTVLALAASQAKTPFTYDGTWDATTDNFNVTAISTYANAGSATWQALVNGDAAPGQPSCSQSLNWGTNSVWWVYNPDQYQHLLHLKGPGRVDTGKNFTVTVTDLRTGQPVQGATVQGQTTGTDGTASLVDRFCGPNSLRATMAGSLTSNSMYMVAIPYRNRKRCV